MAVSRNDYMYKMERILADRDTYALLTKNPIKKLETSLNSMLKNWLSKQFITQQEYFKLRLSDGHLPRAYGLPKIHKEGYPYRIIVSFVGSPLHNFAGYLHNLIHSSIPVPRAMFRIVLTWLRKLILLILTVLFHFYPLT